MVVNGEHTQLAFAAMEPEGDEARAALLRYVRSLARSVVGGRSRARQAVDDFVDDAASLVWSRMGKFRRWYDGLPETVRLKDGGDLFAGWCSTVIRNAWRDAARRASRRPGVVTFIDGAQATLNDIPERDVNAAEEDEGSLVVTENVLRRLNAWDPVDGAIAFALGGAFDALPTTIKEEWLAAAGLDESFVTKLNGVPHAKRREVLASAMNVGRNAIDQRWGRLSRKYFTREERGLAVGNDRL